MKWLWSRLWDNMPSSWVWKVFGPDVCQKSELHWLLMVIEEWVCMRFPDSWYDQNDGMAEWSESRRLDLELEYLP